MKLGEAKPEQAPNIVMLISGSGSNMAAVADQLKAEAVYANIAAVISNKADAGGLQKAQERGLHTEVLSHKEFATRESYDQALIKLIDGFEPDLIVLAGFMRVLSADFVQHYADRIINIHPALLPNFKGLHTHQRALEAGANEHGATVHFIDDQLDEGVNIIQATVPVLADDTEFTLQQRVLVQEHIIYPIAVKWFVEGRLKLKGNTAYLDGQALPSTGLKLS